MDVASRILLSDEVNITVTKIERDSYEYLIRDLVNILKWNKPNYSIIKKRNNNYDQHLIDDDDNDAII